MILVKIAAQCVLIISNSVRVLKRIGSVAIVVLSQTFTVCNFADCIFVEEKHFRRSFCKLLTDGEKLYCF